jgi:uncharacterized protein YdeI (YjbR/CyaY-like superfamily)
VIKRPPDPVGDTVTVSRDKRIDAYIDGAQPVARPLLEHGRDRVHAVAPDVEETLKWSMPTFTLRGKILLGMAAFKAHATVNFWRGRELHMDTKAQGMGQLGRLTAIGDRPADFDDLIRQAAALARSVPAPRRPTSEPSSPCELHSDFAAALAMAPLAKSTLESFPASAQREYIEWIAEAKQEVTRQKRIATAFEWLNDGKRRNWKYQSC